ncbi:FecR domain-containing protein [Catenovulum maritimum]|uniref:FecR family protein n=1 Tax=Catenovulum maritimum TaxID=1513271 RepID=UPI0006616E43|nr:FecR family protein [Catenovulum maritimum]
MKRLKCNLASLCTLSAILFSSFNSFAQDTAGKTIIAKGTVVASSSIDSERKLKRRSPVYKIDTVMTGENSRAQFKMMDGGLLALQANTQLKIATYKYDPETDEGSAVMELISGGIRTVSGKIKNKNGSYKLNTPVGSIGIRGTHFEVEIVEGDVFLAVWDGAIDITTDTGIETSVFSLGDNEGFSFARIDTSGDVEGLVSPPQVFEDGHSNSVNRKQSPAAVGTENTEQENAEVEVEQTESLESNNLAQPQVASTSNEEADDNLASVAEIELAELPEKVAAIEIITEAVNPIADRVGTAVFDQLSISSSTDNILESSMVMDINFDNNTVDNGELVIKDEGGEWHAAFNGTIKEASLDIGVNFASYNDIEAEGGISGQFDSAVSVLGQIELSQIETETAGEIETISAQYRLGESLEQ